MREYLCLMVLLCFVKFSLGFKTKHGAVSYAKMQITNTSLEIKIQDKKLLHSAPCPPPWDLYMLFSESVCLNCDQRIVVLERCLDEWNLELDCEQILSCTDCTSCGLCQKDTMGDGIVVTLSESTGKTDEADKTHEEHDTTAVVVPVLLSFVGSAIVLSIVMVVIWRKRRQKLTESIKRQETEIDNEENKYDSLLNVKSGIVETDNEKKEVLDKLLYPEQEIGYFGDIKDLHTP